MPFARRRSSVASSTRRGSTVSLKLPSDIGPGAAAPGAPGELDFSAAEEARLLASCADNPERLARVNAALRRAHRNADRLRALEARRNHLQQKNAALAQSVGDALPSLNTSLTSSLGETRSLSLSVSLGASARSRLNGSPDALGVGAPVPEDWGRAINPYRYRGPAVLGAVSPVFPDRSLFRLVTADGHWAFYNDSLVHDMHVHYIFPASAAIEPPSTGAAGGAPRPEGHRLERLPSGAWDVSMVLHPEQTGLLFRGSPTSFENKSKAVPRAVSRVDADIMADEAADCLRNIVARCEETSRDGLCTAEAVVEVCLRERLPFVDPDFPPCHRSLYSESHRDTFILPVLQWRCPREYLPPLAQCQERLFVAPPQPVNVHGGPLFPDQIFLSVVAALTERPRALEVLFAHPDSAPIGLLERMVGAYRAQLCLSGWWRSVLVDHYVPAAAHCPEFARCRNDLRAVWLPVLEKAYAKAFGSFSAMLEAPLPEIVSHLSGSPCCSLESFWPRADAGGCDRTASFAALMERLLGARGAEVLLTTFALERPGGGGEYGAPDVLAGVYRGLGLAPGTSVGVLGLDRVGETTLLRVRRNADRLVESDSLEVWRSLGRPWAETLWELSIAYGGSSGFAWVDLAEVARYFSGGYVWYPTRGWATEVRVKGNYHADGTPEVAVQLTVARPTRALLSLAQPERRLLDMVEGEGPIHGIALQLLGKDATAADVVTVLQTNGAPDLYAGARELAFAYQGQVAIGAELTPEGSPYLLVPRVRHDGDSDAGTYVLGVQLMDAELGHAGASASFVTLQPSAALLHGGMSIHVPRDTRQTTAEYQQRRKDGAFDYNKHSSVQPAVDRLVFTEFLFS